MEASKPQAGVGGHNAKGRAHRACRAWLAARAEAPIGPQQALQALGPRPAAAPRRRFSAR